MVDRRVSVRVSCSNKRHPDFSPILAYNDAKGASDTAICGGRMFQSQRSHQIG